jgi:hypothetical protein
MKKNGAAQALITPDATGWRLRMAGEDQSLATLEEAVASVPSSAHLELALPCQSVLLERHRLPSLDRAELADMLQLQLEKSLPFPVEEVSHGFELLGHSETESTVLSVTAQHSQLENLCAPLRQNGRVPERISLHALKVASACPADQTVLAVWPEQGQTVFAIVENGKLAWAQAVPFVDAESVIAELPGLMISAELEGVPANFSRILVQYHDLALVGALGTHFQRPVEPLEMPGEVSHEIDLLPPSWLLEANNKVSSEKLKQRLLGFAVVYLLLIAAAFVYLAIQKRQVQKLQLELAAMKPRYAGIASQMMRWKALAPVVEPPRFTAEILHLLARNRQNISPDVEFTSFNFSPGQWTLKGEATTDSHFAFTQKLKKDEELGEFEMQFPPYSPIGNSGKVGFSVIGKPKP